MPAPDRTAPPADRPPESPRPPPPLGALLLGALLLGADSGCSAIMGHLPEFDLNPLARVAHQPDGAVELEALGPFVDVRLGPEGLSHALRPLYQHKALGGEGDAAETRTDVIAPFYHRRTSRTGSRWKIWPLVYSSTRTDGPDGPDWDAALIPFFWMGSGPRDGDGYFAFWPVAGRLRDLFGLETYDFFLWPLFQRTRMDITESSTSWTVLLLGGWTTGGPRDGSWRVLPFYRHRLVRNAEGELMVDQHTAPWPFYTWGYDNLATDAPSERHGLWPLWSHEESDAWSKTTVLWPFFRFNRERDDPERVEGEPGFYYDLPWPLVRWSHGDDADRLRLFPVYSRYDSSTVSSRAWLTVIVRDMRWPGRDAEPTSRVTDVFPFWHSWWAVDRERRRTNHQVWPFWHRETERDREQTSGGRIDEAVPSIFPGRHFDLIAPIDESWTPVLALWSRKSNGTTTDRRWLFDLFQWRDGPEGTRISVPLLFSRRPEADGVHRNGWLWSLVTTRDDDRGLRSFSLLGVDLWRR